MVNDYLLHNQLSINLTSMDSVSGTNIINTILFHYCITFYRTSDICDSGDDYKQRTSNLLCIKLLPSSLLSISIYRVTQLGQVLSLVLLKVGRNGGAEN